MTVLLTDNTPPLVRRTLAAEEAVGRRGFRLVGIEAIRQGYVAVARRGAHRLEAWGGTDLEALWHLTTIASEHESGSRRRNQP